MEVHHHSHTPRKKWTHYFWEFVMLFLAVTLGFFVENQREHYIEHKREKVYIASMIDDLKLDTIEFSAEATERDQAISMYDSLIKLLNQKNRNEFQQQRIYYFARMGVRYSIYPTMNDRTFEQMKSSGNLRLIRHKEITDRITRYYFKSKEFAVNTSQTLMRTQSLIEYQGNVFDGTVFQEMINAKDFTIHPPDGNPLLVTEDKRTINELTVRIHYILSILLYSQKYMDRVNAEASELIEILKKEYHPE
jgi:hypothetical protein